MKKIINGKTYDTDNATAIMMYKDASKNSNPFYHIYEILYLSKSGDYFLYSDNWMDDEKEIYPFNIEDIEEWMKYIKGYAIDSMNDEIRLYLFDNNEDIEGWIKSIKGYHGFCYLGWRTRGAVKQHIIRIPCKKAFPPKETE